MKTRIEKILLAIDKGYVSLPSGDVIGPSGKTLKGGLVGDGYLAFTFRDGKEFVQIAFHQLAAYVKYGNRSLEDKILVRHFNGIKTDNSHENILIGTHSQNMMDIPKDIRLKKALIATSHVRKFDRNQVKDFYKINGWKNTMNEFNITSKGTLSFILNK